MATGAQQNDFTKRIQLALEKEDVPKIYFNGFVNNLSTGDIMVVLERAGKPVGILNMSFTVAKSFCASLGQVVGQLEQMTGRSMLTTREIEEAVKKAATTKGTTKN